MVKKVKWSHYRPGVAQRVGRVITLLFHDCGTRRGWVVSSKSQPHFTPGKDPVPILQEAGWAPGLPEQEENLVPTGIRSWTFQPVVSRYTNWATWPTHMSMVHEYKPKIYRECSLSPHTYPVTCASSISECCSRTCSISFGKMFSPPRIIMSLIRPTTCPNPFSCSTNWSLKSILCQLAGPFIPVHKNNDNLAFHLSYIKLIIQQEGQSTNRCVLLNLSLQIL